MRINGHAHIFNLHTVLTPQAVKVIANRVRRLGIPDFVADAVERFLAEQLLRPEYLVEEELLGRFLDCIGRTQGFQRFADGAANLPVQVRLLGGGIRSLELSALRAALDRLSSAFDDGASSQSTIADVFETLRLAMQPDIPRVAREIFASMRPDDGLVALMMDITSEETAEDDRETYLAQMKGTVEAAISYPGRVFPFVAVNSRRPDHFALMRRAIEQLGFVGVKLYPSLGAPVDAPVMMHVYDYCIEHDVPILLHSTKTGFFERPDSAEFGDPAKWRAILEERPGLRVCFAHAGGVPQGMLTEAGPQPGQWPHTIVELMREFDAVYTDLSYHVGQMAHPEGETNYLRWLRGLLSDIKIGDRVIFGTDIWLVRLSLPDSLFWQWFETNLTAKEMALVAERAPAMFLGLPQAGQPARPNIQRLVAFLSEQRSVGSEPAHWLKKAAGQSFVVRRVSLDWTPNNHAHLLTHAFFKRYMNAAQKRVAFEEAGALRLRQFSYWDKEHVPEATFHKDVRAVALALASLSSGSGGTFEGDYTSTTAVDQLAEVLADGEKSLADAGTTVDAVFRFATETA